MGAREGLTYLQACTNQERHAVAQLGAEHPAHGKADDERASNRQPLEDPQINRALEEVVSAW